MNRSILALPIMLALGTCGLAPDGARAAGNVRPFVAVGWSAPVTYSDAHIGPAWSGGLEVEQSERVSMLARVDLTTLGGPVADGRVVALSGPDAPRLYEVDAADLRTASAAFGARLYPVRIARWRTYADATLGARVGLEGRRTSSFSPHGDRNRFNGVVGALHAGITTARRGGGGLFTDVGWEFVARNPARYAVVPVRVGIILP